MNDRTHDLERRLQQATAAECPPPASMDTELTDAETASLREGWLALGQLLETAQPMSDASALEELLPSPQAAPSKASSHWKASLAAALAASLVIGATLAWNFMSRRTEIPSQPTHDVAVEDTDREAPQPIPTVEKEAIAENPTDELQWDDSLDDQLALVSQEIMRIEGDWDYLDDAFSPVWEEIDRIEQDIEEDTL